MFEHVVTVCCIREEGILALWKGNGANVIRIFPYSAAQLAANDTYKRLLEPEGGRYMTIPAVVSVFSRRLASACFHKAQPR